LFTSFSLALHIAFARRLALMSYTSELLLTLRKKDVVDRSGDRHEPEWLESSFMML
jgi:hypothetical protein